MKRKFHADDNFFAEINIREKAQVLGFIYADGCVFKNMSRKYNKFKDLKNLYSSGSIKQRKQYKTKFYENAIHI